MLKHKTLRNAKVATKFGEITFDKDGISKDLSETQQKNLGKMLNVEFIEEKKPTPKKTPAKKSPAKKAPAKKAPAKKEEEKD